MHFVFIGQRGVARNNLLPLENAADFSQIEKPFAKALTLQHTAQAYTSEKLNISMGGTLHTHQGLGGELKIAPTVCENYFTHRNMLHLECI